MSEENRLYDFDRCMSRESGMTIVGIDEAGRGPLAGPVVAAAVILNPHRIVPGINDSKKVPAHKRELLYTDITTQAEAWAVAQADVHEIDHCNILNASLLAMKRAVEQLRCPTVRLLIDGNRSIPGCERMVQTPVVKGDGKSAAIAAASIIAKVTRDRIMCDYHHSYPQWAFHRHKGYATQLHRECIHRHGLSPLHRKSFHLSRCIQTQLPLFS